MRVTPQTSFLLVTVVLIIPLGWWLSIRDPSIRRRDASEDTVNVSKVGSRSLPILQPQKSANGGTSGESMSKTAAQSAAAFMERAERMSATELLTEFELTGDKRLLELARRKYPDDSRWISVAALEANNPEADVLKQLEGAQPDNALPNILKAGMYAEKKNWEALAEQLKLITAKRGLSLNSRERKEALLDLLLSDPSRSNLIPLISATDGNFYLKVLSIVSAIEKKPTLLGSPQDTAAVMIDLAERMRAMGEYGYFNKTRSTHIEICLIELLKKNGGNVPYGSSGITVLERQNQIIAQYPEIKRLTTLYQEAQYIRDPNLRLQFYARARADGDFAALNWYAGMRPH